MNIPANLYIDFFEGRSKIIIGSIIPPDVFGNPDTETINLVRERVKAMTKCSSRDLCIGHDEFGFIISLQTDNNGVSDAWALEIKSAVLDLFGVRLHIVDHRKNHPIPVPGKEVPAV